MENHGDRKFTAAALLASSAGRGWSKLAVDVRSHVAGPIPAFITEATELTLIVRGEGAAMVHRAAHGVRQKAPAVRGTSFIIPTATHEEATFLTDDIAEVMHIYLSPTLFHDLSTEDHLPRFDASDVRYVSGLCDTSLNWLAEAVCRELQRQTSSAEMLIETLGLSLAERIVRTYTDGGAARPLTPGAKTGLDERRLRRVLSYIEDHLEEEISVIDLARVACLSPFHFTRSFAVSIGRPPHKYLSERRLALARRLLAETDLPLAEIAARCSFSSQSNFGRAMSRATGCTPGRYRRTTC